MSYTMKEIVRTVYDSEYCMIDDIQDLDGEEWYFIEEGYDKLFHKYRESYLVSNYARVKSYIGYKAVLMTVKPYKENNDYYMVNFRDGKKRLRRRIHRIVAYHFLLPLCQRALTLLNVKFTIGGAKRIMKLAIYLYVYSKSSTNDMIESVGV